MDQLPPDVIYNIADRLPFKCLVRFMYARKEWYKDPLLKTRMAKFIEKPTMMWLDIQSRRYDPDQKPRFEVDIDGNFVKASIPQLARHSGARVMGTCNGVVCYSQDANPEFLVLVNPLLEEVLSLSTLPAPLSIRTSRSRYGYDCVASGLGLDHASGVYKLVVVSRGYEVLVFDLSTRLWRPEVSKPRNWIPPKGVAVFLDGTLYWHRHQSNFIVSFDVAKEEFAEVLCPASISNLFELGSHLGVAEFNQPAGHINIWELNLRSKEWTNKYNIDSPPLGKHSRSNIIGTQEQMILFKTKKTLYWYDPWSRRLQRVRPTGFATGFYFSQLSPVSLTKFSMV